jgi:hypothetical protein
MPPVPRLPLAASGGRQLAPCGGRPQRFWFSARDASTDIPMTLWARVRELVGRLASVAGGSGQPPVTLSVASAVVFVFLAFNQAVAAEPSVGVVTKFRTTPKSYRAATRTTPVASLGVRGTDLWTGLLNLVQGVYAIEPAVEGEQPRRRRDPRDQGAGNLCRLSRDGACVSNFLERRRNRRGPETDVL